MERLYGGKKKKADISIQSGNITCSYRRDIISQIKSQVIYGTCSEYRTVMIHSPYQTTSFSYINSSCEQFFCQHSQNRTKI